MTVHSTHFRTLATSALALLWLSGCSTDMDKLQAQVADQHEKLARHDQSDDVGLGTLGDELRSLKDSVAELETRWLEVSEQLEG